MAKRSSRLFNEELLMALVPPDAKEFVHDLFQCGKDIKQILSEEATACGQMQGKGKPKPNLRAKYRMALLVRGFLDRYDEGGELLDDALEMLMRVTGLPRKELRRLAEYGCKRAEEAEADIREGWPWEVVSQPWPPDERVFRLGI
ncbi:MAG: hypothetical protein ABSE73_08460 [Planctomycetota bacterium]